MDFKLITILMLLMHKHQDTENLKLTTSQSMLTKFLEEKDPRNVLTPVFRARVRRVFSNYNELISSHEEVFTNFFGPPGAKMQRFYPVEFLGVGIMLYIYSDRPLPVIADDIRGFREYLRSHLEGLRTNPQTWTKIMEYINALERIREVSSTEDESQVGRRSNISINGPPLNPTGRIPAFNPPSEGMQIHSQRTSVYNDRQRRAMEERLALQEQEQREAFQKTPSARGATRSALSDATSTILRGHDYAGRTQGHNKADSRKRTRDGLPIKREERN